MYLILGQKPGIFDVIIINDNLEDAYDQLKNALLAVSKECLHILYQPKNSPYTHTHHLYMYDNTFLTPNDLLRQLPCEAKSAAFVNK